MADLPAHDHWLTEPEATRLRGLVYTKRREEARLGRWTAKRAVAATLGLAGDDHAALRDVVIRNASDGAPEVHLPDGPAPVAISMTDRADWAVCAVVAGVSLGCDLELVEPRSRAFVADYLTHTEQRVVAGAAGERDLYANLMWSAKESALKVLRTGLRRDTRSVEVTLVDDTTDGWHRLEVVAVEGDRFPGWWRRFGDFVLTVAASGPIGPPVSLVEPSPLESAVPAHSWMAAPLRGGK